METKKSQIGEWLSEVTIHHWNQEQNRQASYLGRVNFHVGGLVAIVALVNTVLEDV
jgi:hypothetical protein